jgi:hypothetical protein
MSRKQFMKALEHRLACNGFAFLLSVIIEAEAAKSHSQPKTN